MNDLIKNKALYKAMHVLECFKSCPELGISQISEMLGLNKSNVHDILSTFMALKYVTQNPENNKYKLDYKILDLSHVLTSSMGFRKTVYPHIQKLAVDVNETVYYAIPDGDEMLYLDSAYPVMQMNATRAMLGDRAKMYCTAIGKAVLSCMPREKLAELIKFPLQAYTDRTITTMNELIEDLNITRERGYSIDNMEHEYGIKCVGVPILDNSGTVVSALSISGPSLRFSDESIQYFADKLINTVQMINCYY